MRPKHLVFALTVLVLALPVSALAQTPAPSRRQAVHAAISVSTRIPYSSGTMTDTWDVISLADADPSDPTHVLTLYGNQSLPRQTGGNDQWNREHLWPQSLGTGDDGPCGFAHNDLHHLFASEAELNQSRSNLPFDDCTDPDCSAKALRDGSDRANWMKGGDLGRWEVWANNRTIVSALTRRQVLATGGRRGDVARALFYMDIRYEGGTNPATGCEEPDLVLTNDRSRIASVPAGAKVGYMGVLSTLCRWHRQDPVDALERHRNNVIASFQGNRNPFIDRSVLVDKIWGCGVYMPIAGRAPTSSPLPTSTPRPTSTPTASPMPVPTTSVFADLAITTLQCETRDEFIRITNRGGVAVAMQGWHILSVQGAQVFGFPAYRLDPGASVKVHSGPDAPESGGEHLRWTTGYIWNNDNDSAELKAPTGEVVDRGDC